MPEVIKAGGAAYSPVLNRRVLVEKIDGVLATCVWFSAPGVVKRAPIHIGMLKYLPPGSLE